MNIPDKILSNGIKMPMLGFGTWQVFDHNVAKKSVLTALELGYRHIDTAALYKNEKAVGEAIKESGIPREEIFLVTKLWNDDALKAFQISKTKLSVDYVDLYLIHWPKPLDKETWRAFEKLYDDSEIKAIGVSNYLQNQLENLISVSEIKPMVNQIEFHPYLVQPGLLKYCSEQNIQVEAWSPIMQGKINEVPLLGELAEKYGRTTAQIVLRWDIQMNIITIPKSVHTDRIKSNMLIFDFELSQEDVNKITALDKFERLGPDPGNFDF
jgi:diketogulonate reductase-like aldo/keto reductase